MNNIKAHLAVLGTNLFFAVNYSLIKFISPALAGPFAVTLLRTGGSLLLFWLAWFFEKQPAGFRRKDLGRFLACGLLGIAINQMLFIKGLTLTSTIHASLLTLATPILVSVFALWVLKEGFTLFKSLGLLLGIGGALLLIFQKQSGGGATPDYLYGDLLILLNAIAYGGYFILVKPLTETYSPLHVVRWAFTFGCIMVLPFSWGEATAIHWSAFTAAHIAALVAVIVAGTFLAYYFNAYAIDRLGAGIAGTYIYTQPLFAVLIATLLLGESLTIQKIAAGFLIFAGVYLVSLQRTRASS